MRGKEEGLFPRPPPSFPFWVPPSVRHPNTIESPPIAYVCIPPPSSFRPNLRGESDLRTTVASAVEYTSRLQEEKRVYPPSHPSQKSQHLPMRSLEHYHQASALGRRRGGFVHAKLPSCSISVHVKNFLYFGMGSQRNVGATSGSYPREISSQQFSFIRTKETFSRNATTPFSSSLRQTSLPFSSLFRFPSPPVATPAFSASRYSLPRPLFVLCPPENGPVLE